MIGDLGAHDAQVHDQPREQAGAIRDFWFALTPEEHFAKSEALDVTIATRFGAWRDAALASGAAGWRDDPQTLLAAIILLDQFSRNIHRGTAEAFAADPLALSLTHDAIARGWDGDYTDDERVFLYLPLMHAEDATTQDLCVEKYAALGRENNLAFARDHRTVIQRFGRFPGRNDALGRDSSDAERRYLEETGGGW
ncbi:hypothetical protein ASG67_04310 [Sphingomonas sp. Leaf339]|uniref:DUF924 family protein n=1 Tax=Sphingomonas sp. Leaf339 TaxID=1736343 RepID=UPI0006F65E07|nr:DUF924 family protein [Sphingomonas sp. Leaf339]KQU62321.1 hypothetical protein ASG67_04310 [Sphingomonas sp. Leaf339]